MTVHKKNGEVTITATANADSEVSGSCKLTVALFGDLGSGETIVEDADENGKKMKKSSGVTTNGLHGLESRRNIMERQRQKFLQLETRQVNILNTPLQEQGLKFMHRSMQILQVMM